MGSHAQPRVATVAVPRWACGRGGRRLDAPLPAALQSEGHMDPANGRRDFIKASAVAAGAVLIKPESVFASPASDAVALGIIGCGGRGNAVARDLVNAGARVVALHDLFDDRLAETRDRFDKLGAEKGYSPIDAKMLFKGPDAYHQLLQAPIDAVLITSPPYFHPDHFEAPVPAGRPASPPK